MYFKRHLLLISAFALVSLSSALYGKNDDVVELTDSNFKQKVLNDDSIWLIEFYAPWCGHCKNLVPEYKKIAKIFKGIVKVGAVDTTKHSSVGEPYGIQGFPTIKIFSRDKKNPTDYNGQRNVNGFVDTLLEVIRKTVKGSAGSSGSGKSGSSGGAGGNEVVELTDANFNDLVLNSKEPWLVEFFAPWCGHCKNLEPHWKEAASQLKGQFKLGAVDATVHQNIANSFGVKGYPTIKFFPAGSQSANDAANYDGGRTTNDIVNWAKSRAVENLPPPELKQVISKNVFDKNCKDKQLAVISFLPHILDCQSKCRNNYLKILKELTKKFKKNPWCWLWTEAVQQPDLEKGFEIGGFGYPAMIAVNPRKLKFSTLTGSFGIDGINEFLRDLSYGKGKTISMKGTEFPQFETISKWDGKDAEMPVEEEIDLSDVDLTDNSETGKSEL